ncbi:MAG: hypothetical protein KKG09_07275 [Verrucomicrobia bacterium]|nr:hypothetical protein [Verrucomicrobiota bacterium]MCG2681264.1 hypothetical protein [Kiritimatiellia bacterium]MBU4246932.1 hypothetical protein [Verrucomicrobiota bacterium]MBU4291600.1 hypothetical protein [Verrucomicrobiota bacterium]MBU4428319.1 hypothetical protein [Verrucomicrobiota bacterium]
MKTKRKIEVSASEQAVLDRVEVRLIRPREQKRFDEPIETQHYQRVFVMLAYCERGLPKMRTARPKIHFVGLSRLRFPATPGPEFTPIPSAFSHSCQKNQPYYRNGNDNPNLT